MKILVHRYYIRVLKKSSATGINTNINTSLIVGPFTNYTVFPRLFKIIRKITRNGYRHS